MLSWIEIDAAALRSNYREFCRIAGAERVAPVVKSNAYGHGLSEVFGILHSENPAWLCTNYVEEAETLRGLGYEGRILVVGPAVERNFARAAACRAELVVGNWEVLHAFLRSPEPLTVHVKFDTGMSRQGFLPAEAEGVRDALTARREQVEGLCTHFANVEDVTDHTYASDQLERFEKARQPFRTAGWNLLEHAASSASCMLMPGTQFGLCRVGISLYGFWPSQATRISYLQAHNQMMTLKPVLEWKTEVTTLKPVTAGNYIGYGCTFRAVRDMQVAVLPVGYYEGYPRIAGDPASYVLIRGERCPIVGRLCMNMMMVDVTHVESVCMGDPVTLIGRDGSEAVWAEDVAGWAQTIHYEIVTCLNAEIPRIVKSE